MEKSKTVILKRNGKPNMKPIKVEVSEHITNIGDFIETINEQSKFKLGSEIIFYTSNGNQVRDETLFLIKDNEEIYLEPFGNSFDANNILQQYKITEYLGKGGFGSVHKAQHKEKEAIVAIKYINITEYSTCSLLP